MKTLLALLFLLPAVTQAKDVEAWDALLKANVKDGKVNYKGFADSPDFAAFVAAIGSLWSGWRGFDAATTGAVEVGTVLTFLLLMRSGYRWARTLLSGGGISTVIYTLASLFTVSRPPVAAIVFAITGIVGSVLIGGGMYLLHRQDGHGFFTR